LQGGLFPLCRVSVDGSLCAEINYMCVCVYPLVRGLYSKTSTTFIQTKEEFHKLLPNAVYDEEIVLTRVLLDYQTYFHLCR
jgi:hypothetical protein